MKLCLSKRTFIGGAIRKTHFPITAQAIPPQACSLRGKRKTGAAKAGHKEKANHVLGIYGW
jgi:hypothetical protein